MVGADTVSARMLPGGSWVGRAQRGPIFRYSTPKQDHGSAIAAALEALHSETDGKKRLASIFEDILS